METQRLRIAMQKSGRLSQDSQALFKSCGLKINLREQRSSPMSRTCPSTFCECVMTTSRVW